MIDIHILNDLKRRDWMNTVYDVDNAHDQLKDAMRFASIYYHGKNDLSGERYISHLRRVAEKFDDPVLKIVAYLHDIVEDCSVTLDELSCRFPKIIIDAVDALTRRSYETYSEYKKRVVQNSIAIQIKIADLHDNMNIFRLSKITQCDLDRTRKYVKFYKELLTEYEKLI